jgi:hypothetical protein
MNQVVTKTKSYPISCEWEIDEISLRTKIEGHFSSPEFQVDGIPGVKWWLMVYPNGIHDPHNHLSVYMKMQTTKSIFAIGKFLVKGTALKKRLRHTFSKTAPSHGSKNLIPLSELYETYIQNGKLIIQLQATLAIIETATTKCIGREVVDVALEIPPSLSKFMYEDGPSKDVTFYVGSESIQVHSKVLGYHSPVFERMFNGGMKESIERKVQIDDFEFEVVRCAIHFCYDMYSPFVQPAAYPYEQLLRFVDKYNMQKLMDFCEKFLISKIDISNVCNLIQLADDCNAPALKEKCMNFMSDHFGSTAQFNGIESLDSSIVKQVMVNVLFNN